MVNNNLKTIKNIKIFMVVLVVFYHCCCTFGGNWISFVEIKKTPIIFTYILNFLNMIHVQTFTMASGYIFYYMRYKENKYREQKKDIKKRFARLIIPYLIISILWAIPFDFFLQKSDAKTIFTKYFFATSPSQLWFLPMLFLVFLFFYFFSDKIKICLKNLILLFFITTLIVGILSVLDINYFQIATATRYIIYFYLGGYLFKIQHKFKIKHLIITQFTIITLSILFTTLQLNNISYSKYLILLFNPILSIGQITIIYYIFKYISNKNINCKLIKIINKNSFGIYLFHQQYIYIIVLLLNKINMPIPLLITIYFIFSLTCSIITTTILKKSSKIKKLLSI